MLLFKGQSKDARYEYENLYLKFITGDGFKNNHFGEAYIYCDGEWIEIDASTLEIVKVN